MFVGKLTSVFIKINTTITLCLGIIVQTSNGISAEILEDQISNIVPKEFGHLYQSLFDHYKVHEDFKSIALIKNDFSVVYEDIQNSNPALEEPASVENIQVFLHNKAIHNPQILGTAGVFTFNKQSRRIIVIYSKSVFENYKEKLDLLNIPKLGKFNIKGANISNFSLSEEVLTKESRILNNSKACLLTTGLYDCVGIVAQGIDISNKESALLAHFYREQNIIDLTEKIINNFQRKELMISLITSQYTPHLFNIINCLKKRNLTIKGYSIGNSYSQVIGKDNEMEYYISVRPLSFKPIDLSPTSLVVIPGNENVFFANAGIGIKFES